MPPAVYKYQIDWNAAYQAFRCSGLSLPRFHKLRLHEFSADGRVPKSFKTASYHFRRLSAALGSRGAVVAAPAKGSLRESLSAAGSSSSVRVVEASAAELADICDRHNLAVAGPSSGSASYAAPTPFQIRLPGGATVRFMTNRAEQLALQMVLASGQCHAA